MVQAGWARRCDREDNLLFPRTDPAVIVLVTDDDDRVLLGSNALWEQHRFSLLAGFVEPGESLEAAVVREIGEEAGVHVDRVEYVGLAAVAAAREPHARVHRPRRDGAMPLLPRSARRRRDPRAALVHARRARRGAPGEIALPGRTSIARWLLERWYGGPIAEARTATTS